MDFRDYQRSARRTSQWTEQQTQALLIGLLGLAGEAGSLLTEYKKRLRDGEGHREYRDRMAEELGDVLWYVSEVASCLDLDLREIAITNLQKVADRWSDEDGEQAAFKFTTDYYDSLFPQDQQIPRQFTVKIRELREASTPQIVVTRGRQQCGDPLTDNSFDDDGYRFHDVFHLAYAAVLRWSPVTRKLLACKRRSQPKIDEVQDGGRAIVLEEGIAAFVFDYARKHNFFEGVRHVDTGLLRTVRSLVSGLEVSSRSARDWEKAILDGYRVWRKMRAHRGGYVRCDLEERTIRYRRLRCG